MDRNPPPRLAWLSAHVLLVTLAVFSLDSLLLKFHHAAAPLLPISLLLMLGLAWLLRGLACRVPALERRTLHRAWAALDGVGVIWLIFLIVLLIVFQNAFIRASGDGREYFAQLHSVFIDHDLNFSNEARDFGTHDTAIFPFGSAVLWMPFYLVAHLWLAALDAFGARFPREGYFYPYQMAIGLGSLTYGFAGLVLIYKVACDYFSRSLALVSTLVLSTGSFIVWYLAVDNSYSHGNSLFAVTLFLFVWYRTRTDRTPSAWWWLGMSGGLMVMVRWQNAAFLAPLASDLVAMLWRTVRRPDRLRLMRATAQASALAALGFVVGFLPQMVFWKVVNGHWLGVPQGQAGQQWWRDSLMLDVLFSPNHGLLAWHPLVYLSLLGVPLFVARDFYFGSLLTLLFAAQVYVNGAVTTWWGGTAFGGRRFDGCAMLFVLGLAALIRWCQKRPAVLWASVFGVLLLGNLLLMQAVYAGRLPMGEGISVEAFVDAMAAEIGNPFSFPANAIFAWRNGTSPLAYDHLGLHLYQNVPIDVGASGDDRFLMSGWSAPEQENGVTFRWATGRQSTVTVALMGPRFTQPDEPQQLADYVLRLRAAPFVFPGSPPQAIDVDVNGTPAGHQILEPGFRSYEVIVSHRLLHRNLNVITFHYGYARAPQELKMNDDGRQLAVRFDEIDLMQWSRPQQ